MLAADDLHKFGLSDPDRAYRIIVSLAGQGVTDDDVDALLPTIVDALKKSPDPDRALNNFARWIESVQNRFTHFQYLLRHPAAVDIFFNVCGVSQLFSDILIRNPEYFEILANPGVRGGAKSAGALYRELSAFLAPIHRTELRLEAMRRFKQREFLRIGTRDILGLADMPTTAREFSNLADACVQKCFEMASGEIGLRPGEQPPPFIVVAMGKHGGRELNYSSDIDLLFVTADDGPITTDGSDRPDDPPIRTHTATSPLDLSHRLAELIIQFLTKNLENGHLFRVDMRLRPEGRFGALVRTLSSYRAYYESWAEPWERQALIKARMVAGDGDLGDAFLEMVTPFVYRGRVTSDFVDAIRNNKVRIEQKALVEGASRTNVKVGSGGIRDIEFTAQLLQLQLGGRFTQARTPNTLEAIAQLRHVSALSEQEAEELSDDYRFLRTVEHRLQILYELQTQSLPTEPAERRLLSQRLGFADAAAFDAEYDLRTQRVRGHCERLFYGSRQSTDTTDRWAELLAVSGSHGNGSGMQLALDAEGVQDPARAEQILLGLAYGSDYGDTTPQTRELFVSLAGKLIDACTRTGDPDAAIRGIEDLAHASPNPAALYRALLEGDDLLDRLTRMAAGSLSLAQTLARRPEWIDMLVSEEAIDPQVKSAERYRAELEERAAGARDLDRFYDAVALYLQRERLRTGARDLWGEVGPTGVMHELTALAEATMGVLLSRAISESSAVRPGLRGTLDTIAIIGLGKLGGRELGYTSDWDVNVVYLEPAEERTAAHTAVEDAVAIILGAGPALTARGAPVEIDARLRPEGRVGSLARSPEDFENYYRTAAQPWERQVLTRARPVAGDAQTAASFMRMRDRAIYSNPAGQEEIAAVRAMKRRIETERLKSEDRWTNVKLGWGGMSDIEFQTQLMQLRYGSAQAAIRVPDTIKALHALGAAGILPVPDAARLAESYSFYGALRNRMALTGSVSPDTLPVDIRRLRPVAIGMGVVDTDSERAETRLKRQFDERMVETRAVFDRRFYA